MDSVQTLLRENGMDELEPDERWACLACLVDEKMEGWPELLQDARAKIERQLVAVDPAAKFSTDTDAMDVSDGGPMRVTVTMLTGQSASFEVSATMQVTAFMEQVKAQFGVEVNKQRLLINGQEFKRSGQVGDCGITNGCSIQLIQMLYSGGGACPAELHLDLGWGYPQSGRDYLDGTCFAYAGESCKGLIDYSNKSFTGLTHSGDIMSDTRGKHLLKVRTKDVPAEVDRLFFGLSAYTNATMAAFPSPSVALKNGQNDQPLMDDWSIAGVKDQQAVIMCVATRSGGGWDLDGLGKGCGGNAKDYARMKQTCLEYVRSRR